MIDWEKITELHDEIGADDFGEVAMLFLSDADLTIAALDTAKGLEASMHYLKGSALTLGFSDLAQLCRHGEQAAAAGRCDAVDPAAIRDCFSATRERFLAELPDRLSLRLPAA